MQLLNKLAIKALSGVKAIKDQITKIEDGASSVEWVLIVAGIAGVITIIITFVTTWWGDNDSKIFEPVP